MLGGGKHEAAVIAHSSTRKSMTTVGFYAQYLLKIIRRMFYKKRGVKF